MFDHWDRDRLILSICIIVFAILAILGITFLLTSHQGLGPGGSGGSGGGSGGGPGGSGDGPGGGGSGTVTPSEEIRIEILDSEQGSLIGQLIDFVSDTPGVNVYFQPGTTYYTEGFQITNTGDVPIKFHLQINDEKNLNREEFYEAFDVYITTDPTNPNADEQLTSFTGYLQVGQSSELYYVGVRMKATAGNEFQDRVFSGIGITVYAVEDIDTTK